MNELNRRVAVEIMGEPEPPLPDNAKDLMPMGSISVLHVSDGGNWSIECGHVFHEETRYIEIVPEWHPLPFSSNLEYAMKAWERFRKEFKAQRGYSIELIINHDPEWEIPFVAATGYTAYSIGEGVTLPEAICNLLLALVNLDHRKKVKEAK